MMTAPDVMRIASLAAMLLASLSTCTGDKASTETACALAADQAQLNSVVTSLAFNESVLAELGVTAVPAEATGSAPQHSLSVLPGIATSFRATTGCMALELDDGHVSNFAGTGLAHVGGPTLVHRARTVDLDGFSLRAGSEPRTFDLFTAGGHHILRGTLPHFNLEPATGALDVFNVDLSATPTLAAMWGMPQLSGFIIGTMTVRGEVSASVISALAAIEAEQGAASADLLNACDDFSGEVDVALIGMGAVQQRGRVGNQVVITPSATLKNVGTANVPWQAKFSGNRPPYDTDQHPFLVWALYREANGIFEMLSHSDIKHAFLTINNNCDPGACRIGSVLGLGCEDVYGVGTNGTHLGPRSEVSPNAGTWAHCDFPQPDTPSHFDKEPPFCQQDFNGSGESALEHRVVASDAELSVPGANYYFASWYVIRDDINIFNTMGWRRIVPTLVGSTWRFDFASALNQGSVLDAWVDPDVSSPTKTNVIHTDASGSAQLAASVTDNGQGSFRYVYGLHNHDYDPELGSITIPVAEGTSITEIEFRDGDGNQANDWTAVIENGAISFTAPSAGSRLSWGTMLTVSFLANGIPANGVAELTRSDTGAGITVDSLMVGAALEPPKGLSDDFESGATNWTASGLWHRASNSRCPGFVPGYSSATNAFYYGRDESCSYGGVGSTSGALTSRPINGVTRQTTLSFRYFRQVERNERGAFDHTEVDIVTASGATTVFSLDSRDPSTPGWASSGAISLAEFAGQPIRVRFRFTSGDALSNDHVGWFIDDVRVK